MFNDTITLYNKISDTEWQPTIIKGVQWSDKTEKQNLNGKISVVRYVQITFPAGSYEGLTLQADREEDCIIYGSVGDVVTGEKGSRISDLLKKYPKSGRIQSINDNSNRRHLKNIKVVIA
ncbi:MAG: hypothetical protein IJP31_04600 [Lachnospiraceae bacterium]|nr:hypothetical protein [Lachnospiraceae bacterium]